MKILVSGFTALQVGSTKRQIFKIDVPAAFVETLREQGHEVEWRKVWCKEEDFSSYDLMIACVAPITSSNAPNGLGALKAMNRIKNVVVFYDDWKLQDIQNSFRRIIALREKQLQKKWSSGIPFYKDVPEDVENSKDDIFKAAEDLYANGRESWKILCPMFEWGNKDIVFKFIKWLTPNNFNYIDPTPAVIDVLDYPIMPDKKREWCIASISDQTKWIEKQNLSWPVNYFGCRKLKCERLKTELDVFEKYMQYHGVLSPAYPSSGSGWFRARYVYAAMANSVLWCGKKDADMLGQAYQIEPSLIELYDSSELLEVSRKQQQTMFNLLTSKGAFVDKLLKIIEF